MSKSRAHLSASGSGHVSLRNRMRRLRTVIILLFMVILLGCRPNNFQTPTMPPLQPSATLMPTPTASPTHKPTFTPSPSNTPIPTDTPIPTPTLAPFNPIPGQIVFTSEQNGLSDLYLISSDGSGLQRLTDNGNNNRDPAWSPDGSRLAFTSPTVADDGSIQAAEIYMMNNDGSGQVSLTADLREEGIAVFNPAWSPDGSWLAFDGRDASRLGEAFNTSQIYLADTYNRTLRRITDQEEGKVGCQKPQWDPAGYRIIMYCRSLMQGGLAILDIRDSSTTALIDWPEAYPIAISHDGKVIAFPNGGVVELISVDGSSDWPPVYLPSPTNPVFTNPILGFAWSPVRNNQLAVLANSGLYLIHVTSEGWEPQEIIRGIYQERSEGVSPSWSPDGTTIVFPSTIDGQNDLFIAPIDGTGLINLTHSEADESQPAWRP